MEEYVTDCRSDIGITTGLIDSIISICRILRQRDLTSCEVLAALEDLAGDEDLEHLVGVGNIQERERKARELKDAVPIKIVKARMRAAIVRPDFSISDEDE